MATALKTPGVYVRDIERLPVVEQVETAVPAFVGYTEKAEKDGQPLFNAPQSVSSLAEFEFFFGGAPSDQRFVQFDDQNAILQIRQTYYLYYSLKAFFDQGGRDCFVVSVGEYGTTVTATALTDGVGLLESVPSVTLLAVPDVLCLNDKAAIGTVHQVLLKQCYDLQNRVAILDLKETNDFQTSLSDFRDQSGNQYLRYGAAYAPQLITEYTVELGFDNIRANLTDHNGSVVTMSDILAPDNQLAQRLEAALDDVNTIEDLLSWTDSDGKEVTYIDWYNSATTEDKEHIIHSATVIDAVATDIISLYGDGTPGSVSTPEILEKVAEKAKSGSALNTIVTTLASWDYGYAEIGSGTLGVVQVGQYDGVSAPVVFPASPPAPDFNYNLTTDTDSSIFGFGSTEAEYYQASAASFRALFSSALRILNQLLTEAKSIAAGFEGELELTNSAYATIIEGIRERGIAIPPSGVMAGVMAVTDAERGVWKAPANVELNLIAGLSQTINSEEQEGMNVDPVSGKSINAIRAFPGKGILVWGARTLAGNDNEWRYLPVRRLYNSIEQSLKLTLQEMVFENNDGNTWLKTKTLVENFLIRLWRQGALAGDIPDQAFTVAVGLNQTMTAQDVLEGRMIVEIGLAAVRPAEFITLKLTYQLQEA